MGALPAHVILAQYVVIGSGLSFWLGREPGTLPADIVAELWAPCVALCLVIIFYSTIDVLAVGIATEAHPKPEKPGYPDVEEVYLAKRAQANQVEQLPGFIVAITMFSVFVNGPAAGVLGLGWGFLRQLYTWTYRRSAGVPMEKKGLIKYTIPCYFILNGMAMGAVVQLLRYAATRYLS